MKKRMKWLGGLVAMLFAVGAFADVISVNFYNGNAVGAIDTNVFTGVVTDLSWQDVVYTTGTTGGITDVDGSLMDVAWTTTAQVTLGANGWPGRHALGVNNNNSYTVDLSEIPYAQYYLVVYVNGYMGANLSTGSVAVASTTKYYTADNVGTLVESTDTNISDGADLGTYLTFGSEASPLTGSSVSMELTKLGGTGVGIGAVQVVEVIPEPATIGMFGLASAVILLFRHRLRR